MSHSLRTCSHIGPAQVVHRDMHFSFPDNESISNALCATRQDMPYKHRRGDSNAYARYLSGMDASMRQKVALMAAHLPAQGRVVDMGMGSGAGSEALAGLYPGLDVVGMDLDPMMVDLASERFQRENLRFVCGDIAGELTEVGEGLASIVNSSVLHHVTSFGGYLPSRADEALGIHARHLLEGGVLIVRDFLRPTSKRVWMDLPADDGEGSAVANCSTAALFEIFAADFRSLSSSPGFAYRKIAEKTASQPPIEEGRVRYEVDLVHAAEFLLRKDYREDYEKEAKEEYTYFTQEEFEEVCARHGLRVLASLPIWNPWIVQNRLRGRVSLWNLDGSAEALPATNYVIAAERVREGEGVRICWEGKAESRGFLRMNYYAHRENGRVMDLVKRPQRSMDVIPWFERDDSIYLLCRAAYPRPIAVVEKGPRLDRSRTAGYLSEPLLVIQEDEPLGATCVRALESLAGIREEEVLAFDEGSVYFPSPGGIDESVTSVLVQVDERWVSAPLTKANEFFGSGRVGVLEAQQLLRSAQVGGLTDARLELNAYDLLLRKQHSVGPWIGEKASSDSSAAGDGARVVSLATLLNRPHRRVFRRCGVDKSPNFLGIEAAEFCERDAQDREIARAHREYVVPQKLSLSTVALALLCEQQGEVLMALDDDDLPAAQSILGNSELLVTPAWRIPQELTTMDDALHWACRAAEKNYGLSLGRPWQLGGRYHPASGLTPEVVHPYAAWASGAAESEKVALHWVALRELVESSTRLHDGHLRVAALRVAHSLGILS